MQETLKLSERERKCLEVLVEYAGSYEGECCLSFKTICPEGMDIKQTRRAVRSLARKGLAKFYRGLMDDVGMVAGAGYCATEAGCALIEPCDVCGKRARYEYDGKRECQEHYGQSAKQAELPI